MKPAGDEPTASPDQPTMPAARESRPVVATELPSYELREVIGRGGMGEVVLAFDLQIEREVAVKRMRTTDPSQDAVKRFMREARIQARLDHPAIVPVHELGVDASGNPYFTMKRLVGRTLGQALGDGEPTQRLLRAFVDVCFAIELAHERGIVHRDLKPSNVMLGNYGDVYVIDWGLARLLGQRRTSSMYAVVDTLSPDQTATGALLGTPGYMAPEQMRGEDVGPPADVFSLGAILFEILAGESLHPQGNDAITSTLAKPGDSPARRSPDRAIAPELDSLCEAALAEAPDARPSARELAERVQSYLDGDRDLEHRRALAATQIAVAHAALEDPARRAEAGQAATRALALDPESNEAAQLVAKLVLEPPPDPPAELVASLEASEVALNHQRSRVLALSFFSLWLYLPVMLFFQHVASTFQAALLFLGATAMGILSWYNGKTGHTPAWVLLLAHFAFAFLFMRLSGSFVLCTAVVCGQAVALSSYAQIATKRWTLIIWIAVTLLVPVALEYAGLIARTWWITPQGFITGGSILETTHDLDVLFLALGQTALVIVVAMFAVSTTRQLENAHRRAHMQAWHLQQLIPQAQITDNGSLRPSARTLVLS